MTIGTDPEVFLCRSGTSELVPSCGLFGGTKGRPIQLGSRGYGLQEDNVMLEFNIPPVTGAKAFVEAVQTVMGRAQEHMAKVQPDLSLSFDTAHERLFPMELLTSPQALQFGCSPDFDAYEHGRACVPVNPDSLTTPEGAWRFAGGHIHLGYRNKGKFPDFVAASFADLYLGLPSISLDKQPMRRKLYGAPGRFRPTKYGVEYRSLSNFWVHDEDLMYNVATRACRLIRFLDTVEEDDLRSLFKEVPWADVRLAISEENEERASDILSYLKYDAKMGDVA